MVAFRIFTHTKIASVAVLLCALCFALNNCPALADTDVDAAVFNGIHYFDDVGNGFTMIIHSHPYVSGYYYREVTWDLQNTSSDTIDAINMDCELYDSTDHYLGTNKYSKGGLSLDPGDKMVVHFTDYASHQPTQYDSASSLELNGWADITTHPQGNSTVAKCLITSIWGTGKVLCSQRVDSLPAC